MNYGFMNKTEKVMTELEVKLEELFNYWDCR